MWAPACYLSSNNSDCAIARPSSSLRPKERVASNQIDSASYYWQSIVYILHFCKLARKLTILFQIFYLFEVVNEREETFRYSRLCTKDSSEGPRCNFCSANEIQRWKMLSPEQWTHWWNKKFSEIIRFLKPIQISNYTVCLLVLTKMKENKNEGEFVLRSQEYEMIEIID